jgi:RNA polymerase sigma factor (TIGR02999 family)
VSEPESDPTELFLGHLRGAEVTERLFPLIYDELRAIARTHLRGGSKDLLQPTALVHEVYLRLIDQTRLDATGRNHFLALAARTLHRVLVDHARAARAAKRGGLAERITLRTGLLVEHAPSLDLLALDEALTALRAVNERRAEVVELRFFGGLSIEEVAEVLAIAARTVRDDWTMARAFLHQRLTGEA